MLGEGVYKYTVEAGGELEGEGVYKYTVEAGGELEGGGSL